ncbi:hypothetical protein QJQ45_008062 [Haematococcus lacustris]|nr:hypothetical protein QJQ45_008062 [Haematococcus lacustris]
MANLKHITVTLATWDAVWEVYKDPEWAQQWLRLYGAQDQALEQFFKKLEEDMAEVSMERHGRAKQLVVLFGAASIGTGGGWGADAVLRACCKVVCWSMGTDQLRGRVVLVDEHHPVAPRKPPQALCSSQAATQPTASAPGPSTPPPAQRSKRTKAEPAAESNKGKAHGKAAKAKPAPQPGRWLDRDCNAALNMQRIGESSKRAKASRANGAQGQLQQQLHAATAQQQQILMSAAAATQAELEEARSQLLSCQDVNMRTATDLQVCQEQLHQSQQALQQSENEVLAMQVSLHRSEAESAAAKEELAACMSKVTSMGIQLAAMRAQLATAKRAMPKDVRDKMSWLQRNEVSLYTLKRWHAMWGAPPCTQAASPATALKVPPPPLPQGA